MGACLEMLADADPFAVEVRRESFDVSTSRFDEPVMHARAPRNGVPAAFAVPADRLAAFRAALDQVLAHEGARRTVDEVSVLIDAWTVHWFGRELVVQGPAFVYPRDRGRWSRCESVEVEYRDLRHLRNALQTAHVAAD